MVAPLCFSSDPAVTGTGAWPHSISGVPMPVQVPGEGSCFANGTQGIEWAQLCVPFQCMTQQFSPCVIAPGCGSADAMYAALAPLLESDYCSVASISQPSHPVSSVYEQPGAFGVQPIDMSFTTLQVNCYDNYTAHGMPVTQTSAMNSQEMHRQLPSTDSSSPSSPLLRQNSKTTTSSHDAVRKLDLDGTLPNFKSSCSVRWADEPVEQEDDLSIMKSLDMFTSSSAPGQQSMVTCTQRDSRRDEEGAARTCVQKLADWLVAQLGAGGDTREATVANAYNLATSDKSSSRALQLALQCAPSKDAAALALGLRGHVRAIIWSMHGNYVLQKVIEVIPASVACFIVQELRGVAAEVARHRFGCRVLCRLLEHLSSSDDQTCSLIDEILEDAMELCRHNYGNFVIQHILEFGLASQKHVVACVLSKDISVNARHQNAAHAIEKALSYCPAGDRDLLLENLFQDSRDLLELAKHQSGCYVVRALLKLPEEQLAKVQERLRPIAAQLGALNRRQRRITASAADRAAARSSQVTRSK